MKLRDFIKKDIAKNSFTKNIIISNQNFANIITMISLRKFSEIKKILIERNHLDELKFYKNINDFIKKKIILCLIKIYYTQSDAIVGITVKSSNDLGNYINSKVITIYNPSYEEKIIKNYNFQNIKINNKKK